MLIKQIGTDASDHVTYGEQQHQQLRAEPVRLNAQVCSGYREPVQDTGPQCWQVEAYGGELCRNACERVSEPVEVIAECLGADDQIASGVAGIGNGTPPPPGLLLDGVHLSARCRGTG